MNSSSGYSYRRRRPSATRLPRRRLVSPLLAFVLVAATALLSSLVMATDEAGLNYLKKKALEKGVVTLKSGLQYKILKSGKGTQHPAIDTPCSCHYAGTLIDGTTFDSSYKRGSPTTFAPNQVIDGWTEALQLMVAGDKWELYLPSDMAYGNRGSPPDIPPNSALVFTIELIKIQGVGGGGGGSASPVSGTWVFLVGGAAIVAFLYARGGAMRRRDN